MALSKQEYSQRCREARIKFYANGGKNGMLGKKQSEHQKKIVSKLQLGNKKTLGKHWKWSDESRKNVIGKQDKRSGMKNSIASNLLRSESLKGWTSRVSEEKLEKWKAGIRKARAEQVLPLEDTSIEIALQEALTAKGIIFEKHKKLPGLPDIFIEPNICIFADGDYWHSNPKIYGEDHQVRYGSKIVIHNDILIKDRKINTILKKKGYKVLRFWGSDIKKNIDKCIEKIINETK
jgi:DNA mismatch endonuclease (patch repair protein)